MTLFSALGQKWTPFTYNEYHKLIDVKFFGALEGSSFNANWPVRVLSSKILFQQPIVLIFLIPRTISPFS